MSAVMAAGDLQLRDGISFDQDLDNGFPIVGSNIDDAQVEPGRPALIFFGASGDLNTNRQARRLVETYRRYKSTPLQFIVVDVDHQGTEAGKLLLKNYYRGYIPFEVILDSNGKVSWSQTGETDAKVMESQIAKVLP